VNTSFTETPIHTPAASIPVTRLPQQPTDHQHTTCMPHTSVPPMWSTREHLFHWDTPDGKFASLFAIPHHQTTTHPFVLSLYLPCGVQVNTSFTETPQIANLPSCLPSCLPHHQTTTHPFVLSLYLPCGVQVNTSFTETPQIANLPSCLQYHTTRLQPTHLSC